MNCKCLKDGCDQVAELASDDDACCEDAETPNDGEVSWTVFGCEDLGVDEPDEEVLLGCRTTSGGGGEEALLCRAGVSQKRKGTARKEGW